MGNQLANGAQCKHPLHKALFTNNSTKPNDEFVIHQLRDDDAQTIESLDVRRLVFINLPGLYNSWHRVPCSLLYIALFLVPLKRKWLHQPSTLANELQQALGEHALDLSEFDSFVALLRWKHSQGLVIWILDELEIAEYPHDICKNGSNPLVAPIWHKLSGRLMSLRDHIEERHYDPLNFDEEYWTNTNRFCSKYNTTTKSILTELYFVTMNTSAMQEIIYQSNPKTLHPVIEYVPRHSKWLSLPATLAPIIEEPDIIHIY
eukprot:33485_1